MTQYISFDGTYPVRVITNIDGGDVVTDDDVNAEETYDLTADYDSITFVSEEEARKWLGFYAKDEPEDSNELFWWKRAKNIAAFLGMAEIFAEEVEVED